MNLSKFKELYVDGIKLVGLLINGVQVWKSGYKNWVRYSTEADGVTIYNGGLGYKDGYRVRSGGAETSDVNAACTGYIPVNGGDVVRISGCDFSHTGVQNAINGYSADLTILGQIVGNTGANGYSNFADGQAFEDYNYDDIDQDGAGVWQWTVPPVTNGLEVSYIRVTGYSASGGHGANMIVTVNEEIT